MRTTPTGLSVEVSLVFFNIPKVCRCLLLKAGHRYILFCLVAPLAGQDGD